jgi:hypothetical protein
MLAGVNTRGDVSKGHSREVNKRPISHRWGQMARRTAEFLVSLLARTWNSIDRETLTALISTIMISSNYHRHHHHHHHARSVSAEDYG